MVTSFTIREIRVYGLRPEQTDKQERPGKSSPQNEVNDLFDSEVNEERGVRYKVSSKPLYRLLTNKQRPHTPTRKSCVV